MIYTVGNREKIPIDGCPEALAMVKGASEAILNRCISVAKFDPSGFAFSNIQSGC